MNFHLKWVVLVLLFWFAAPNCLSVSLAQNSTTSERQAEAERLLQQGIRQQQSGQIQDALRSWRQAEDIYLEIGDIQGEANALNRRCDVEFDSGEMTTDRLCYEIVINLQRKFSEPEEIANTLGQLGMKFMAHGRGWDASGFFQQQLDLARQIGNLQIEMSALWFLGYISLVYNSQPQQAVTFYQQGLDIARQLEDRQLEQRFLGILDSAYIALSEYRFSPQAIEYFQQRLETARQAGDRQLETTSLNKLGFIYGKIGQYKQSIELYEKALAIARNSGFPCLQAKVLNNLAGDIYVYQGQYQQALKFFKESLSLSQNISNCDDGTTLINLAVVYLRLGQYERAIDFLERALTIARDPKLHNYNLEVKALSNLGNLYLRRGQYSQAIESYLQTLDIALKFRHRATQANALGSIGVARFQLGLYEPAIESFQKSLAISRQLGDRLTESLNLAHLGRAYFNLGQSQQALDLFQQSLTISREVGASEREGEILSDLGYVYRTLGQDRQAIEFYQQSIDIIESIQGTIKIEELKSSFAAQSTDTYINLIQLLWKKGDFESAFNYAERAKARAFLDQIARGKIDFRAGVDGELLEREQTLRGEINALREQLLILKNPPQNEWDMEAIIKMEQLLSEALKNHENLLTDIKIQSPAAASLVSVDVEPLGKIQSLLDDRTTLVEYFVTDEQTFTFIITRNSFNTIPLKLSQEELTEQIKLSRDVPDPNYARDPHPTELTKLYQWLIEPLKPYLDTSHLAIVPHGILHYLPFAALTDGDRYLSDDYALFYLPSANTLRFLSPSHPVKNPTILALGAPEISESEGLSYLNYAKQEVKKVAHLFKTEPLVGKSATESAVWSKAGGANFLLLAAHGKYNRVNPLYSSIYLAADDKNNGRLEVHEIYGLDLRANTNLVVLSACETHVGKLSRGDEVVGMNRAFLYAGTPAVIASLWSVDDEATGLLMQRFFTHLRDGMSAAEALQKAQQKLRQQRPDYSHPYYWAAFSLTGSTGR